MAVHTAYSSAGGAAGSGVAAGSCGGREETNKTKEQKGNYQLNNRKTKWKKVGKRKQNRKTDEEGASERDNFRVVGS